MIDKTHQDSGRIITSGDVIAELQDRIAELEAELEAVGAGGVQALSAAPAIKPLVWSDESGPTEKIRYNHITAETALGQFSVEWKGWKEEDWPCVYLNGDHIGVASNLGGAKQLAERHIRELVANLLAASPTPPALSAAPAEQQAAPKAASGEPDRADATNLARNTIKYPDLQLTAKGVHCLAEAVLEMDNYIAHFVNAAPQQEAQEPVGQYLTVVYRDLTRNEAQALIDHEKMSAASWSHALHERDMAKAAPNPAPAPLSDDTKRLNWLLWKLPGDALRYVVGELSDTSSGAEFRAAIDAALAAQGGKV